MTPIDSVTRDLMGMQQAGESYPIDSNIGYIPEGSYIRRLVHTSVVSIDPCVSVESRQCIQRTAKLYHVVWMDVSGNVVPDDIHARLEAAYSSSIGDDVA